MCIYKTKLKNSKKFSSWVGHLPHLENLNPRGYIFTFNISIIHSDLIGYKNDRLLNIVKIYVIGNKKRGRSFLLPPKDIIFYGRAFLL